MLKKIRELFGRSRSNAPAEARSESPVVHQGPRVDHKPIPSADLDPDAVKIIQRLTRFDHQAYLVGGCVRDLLLGREPKDFDIGTSATPRQIKRHFRNCRIIGRRFRLAHIYFQQGKIIEVATFRAHDGHAPDSAGTEGQDLLIRDDNEFGTPEEDALRRDFTVNALFYDLNNENVLDHTDGLGDVRRRLIRTIGPPEIRFSEDPIRILRAIKFAARLDFTIEPKTLAALTRTRGEIPKAASPRILEELNRYAREGAAARSFELLRETGVFDVLLPELAKVYTDAGRWALLQAALAEMDRRRKDGLEVPPGSLFAALILPAISDELGFRSDGSVEPPRSLDLRALTEDRIRPITQRLRIPRREQERYRQIISLLARMVPIRRVRQSTRRTLVQRLNFPEALWVLSVLGREWGGEFAEAAEAWSGAARDAPAPARTASRRGRATPARERDAGRGRRDDTAQAGGQSAAGVGRKDDDEETREDGEGRPRRRRRRRRRRGGRGGEQEQGGGEQEQGARSSEPEAPSEKPAADLPPPWDDRYFFAALPSAPELPAEEGDTDRYGAGAVVVTPGGDETAPAERPASASGTDRTAEESGTESAEGPDPAEATADQTERPAGAPRRRRRRRRGSRGGSGQRSETDSETGSEPAGTESAPKSDPQE